MLPATPPRQTVSMITTAYSDRPEPLATTARRGATYLDRWRAAPGNAVYLIAGFVLAMVALPVLTALFSIGVSTVVLVIGVPVLAAALAVARGFAAADRFLLRLTPGPRVPAPRRSIRVDDGTGFWRTLFRPLRQGHDWAALLHGMIVNPVLSTVTFSVAVSWIAAGLGGLTYWFWGIFLPQEQDGNAPWVRYVAESLPWLFGGWDVWTVEVVLFLVGGVIFTLTMPWVLDGLVRAHRAIVTAMLGPWRSDELAAEVEAEGLARRAAVHAEDEALRRLERDIHDGPQQRLVRLQMDLAALERRAASGDPDAAAELAREARGHAKAALDELRALSSGVAPPLLQDRGPAAALEAVAASAALPVRTAVDPAVDTLLPPDIARAVYFIAAELLTNTVKHAGATEAVLSVQPDAGGAAVALTVADDGRGGAVPAPGHGLAGLQERVAGLRGTLTLDSPAGGPTTVQVRIPLTA